MLTAESNLPRKTASLGRTMMQTQTHRYPQLKYLTIALVACFVLKMYVPNMLMIKDIVLSNLKSILYFLCLSSNQRLGLMHLFVDK